MKRYFDARRNGAFARILVLMRWLHEDLPLVIHLTRNWLHYGAAVAVCLFTLVAAAEGLAGW